MKKRLTAIGINGTTSCFAHEACETKYSGYVHIRVNNETLTSVCVEEADRIVGNIVVAKRLIKKNGGK